ncbi:MAG: cyclic nucleotide-binding protein [Alcanivorax sp.]|nr:cyclic nucleotide-binding protein [Alcanivorax sp.]
MIDRFQADEDGRRRLVEVLMGLSIVGGNPALAETIAKNVEVLEIHAGDVLIEQGDHENDTYIILTGVFDVTINGRRIAQRKTGSHVGEMAAIQPTQARSASVIAVEESVVAKLPESNLNAIGEQFPEIWRWFAKELARRLMERNKHIADAREKIQVFIISSVEAKDIALEIQEAFEHDDFNVIAWTDGVFKASSYPIESLENQLDIADFAIAIAQPDDTTTKRGSQSDTPRDNVIFELGYFMGRLGRRRALLLEPHGANTGLPSDLSGITTIPYRYEKEGNAAASLAPACNKLRKIFTELGPLD